MSLTLLSFHYTVNKIHSINVVPILMTNINLLILLDEQGYTYIFFFMWIDLPLLSCACNISRELQIQLFVFTVKTFST